VIWNLSEYPLNVYGTVVEMLFTLLVPVGIAIYYPSQAFFGRLQPSYYAFLVVFSIFFIILMYKIFNYLMCFYESGGG
jgi:ABC-type uncharacterized transport system permease subunit